MAQKTKKKKRTGGSFWFEGDIKQYALKNEFYRKVVFTGSHSQLVLMNIGIGEETETESQHADTIVFIVKGKGKSVLDGRNRDIVKHDLVFVPTGMVHSLLNSGPRDLRAIVVYSPPVFAEGEIQKTRDELSPEKTKELERAWEQ